MIDPVTLAVIQAGLQQVCDEMDLTFSRAAFSPVIAEAERIDYDLKTDVVTLTGQARLRQEAIDGAIARHGPGVGAEVLDLSATQACVEAIEARACALEQVARDARPRAARSRSCRACPMPASSWPAP